MIRRRIALLTFSALACTAAVAPVGPLVGAAHAEAPAVRTQVPGFYRMALGDAEVTALYDGYIDLDTKILSNASPAEIQRLLARMFIAGEKVQTAVNTYLVNVGGKLILIDTGTREMIPLVRASIAKLGFQLRDIKILLSGHAHFDHVQGHAAMQAATHAKVMALGDDARVDLLPLAAAFFCPGEFMHTKLGWLRLLSSISQITVTLWPLASSPSISFRA